MAYDEIRTINGYKIEDISARESIKTLEENKADKDSIAGGLHYKGTIIYANLPVSGSQEGDFYYVTDGDSVHGEGNYAWNGTGWYFAGKTTDFGDVSETVKNLSDEVEDLRERKVDGGFIENDSLYLTSDGEVVAGPFTGIGGSGGGGGGTGNNAILTLTNTTGWMTTTIASGGDCILKATWSSIENDIETGDGTLTVRVNNTVKLSKSVAQGEFSVNVKEYLSSGSNRVKITVEDIYANTRSINFTVNSAEISLTSAFDYLGAFTGAINYIYTPIGSLAKVVHFIVDEKEIGTSETSVSGRQQSYGIPAQKHGHHSLEVYFTCTINEQSIESNHLYYDLICVEDGKSDIIIAVDYNAQDIEQYNTISIPYRVYDPSALTTDVSLSVNDVVVSSQKVDRTQQTWAYRANETGSVKLKITADEVYRELDLNIKESETHLEAATEGLTLFLSSYGRSNNESNPEVWKYNDISATLTDFDFISDGWQFDDDGITVLRVKNKARVAIPVMPFANDPRTTGKTIEVEFAVTDVLNYDTEILSCVSGGRGFKMTAQKAQLNSEQSEVFTQYKEDEHVRIAFVIEKRSANRLLYIYINGIMSGVVQYPNDDDFQQLTPVGITIGSNDCTTDIYCIRVYDNDLSRDEVLNNWIADTQDGTLLKERYSRNQVMDAYGKIVIANLPANLPYMVLQGPELPTYKGNKLKIDGYFVNPTDTSRNFTFEQAEFDVQGTSSAGYERKNYKGKFKTGFTLANGQHSDTYSIRGDAYSIPATVFTFKADVASSEGANNVELVRLYNDTTPYKTPPQKKDERIRQGIDGFPMVIFWDDGENVTFLGKYNFNNDKSSEEVFGFAEGDESWEQLNNTSDRSLYKSGDFSGTDWLNDFEGRYPDGNEDRTNLSALVQWVASTDREAATGASITPISYDGVNYTTDSADYRLAKFKAEFTQHFNQQGALFYYIFTELFLMVDSRAKNAFPSFVGGDKWTILPYDMDTALGINNEGSLVFDYGLEDIDTVDGADVFNGQKSVLWQNVRDAFKSEISSMYQTLRSENKLSYDVVEKMFETHQAVWPEVIFNEDAWYKYLSPLVEKGNAAYLGMLQGSKEQQRKWWLFNRFRYIDSKYNAGDSLRNFITLRAYRKGNITITPYADIYASVKYGSYMQQVRALRGNSYEVVCPLDNMNDTECYIYSCDQLADVGDLSGLSVGYADFSMATKLQNLKLGDSSTSYTNSNLQELHLGNNVLLKKIDVRNCPNLKSTVDMSGCTGLEEVYFDGTSVPGVLLPVGGIIKTIHLPATVTSLIIRNQTHIEDLTLADSTKITTLWLEGNGSAVNDINLVKSISAGSRVRLINVDWNFTSVDDLLSLCDVLKTMRGLSETGGNMDTVQVSGSAFVPSLTGTQLSQIKEVCPNLDVKSNALTCSVYFYNGNTLLYTATVQSGYPAAYKGNTPSKSSTAQYSYTFSGWSLVDGGDANPRALKNVTSDRVVYAAFTATVRTYTVRFYNGSTLLQTVQNVPYGGSAEYTGDTPTNADGDDFSGFVPDGKNITGDTNCYAQFLVIEVKEINDNWGTIIQRCKDGTYKQYYRVGNYKPLNLGDEGTVNMQIAGINKDDKADGSGKAPLSWISIELLNTNHRMNPSVSGSSSDGYVEGTGAVGGWEHSEMRTYLSEDIIDYIPEEVRNAIVEVTKTQPYYTTAGVYTQGQTTNDKVWIPSQDEVYTSGGIYTKLYSNSASRIKKKLDATSASVWWLRSANGYSVSHFDGMYTYNYVGYISAFNSYAVALGFCL